RADYRHIFPGIFPKGHETLPRQLGHEDIGIAPHHEANPAQVFVRAEAAVGTIPAVALYATGIFVGESGVANDHRKAFDQNSHLLLLLRGLASPPLTYPRASPSN